MANPFKLDYHITSQAERLKEVQKILNTIPRKYLTPARLDTLTDYIVEGMDKNERKQKKILTDNRMFTINKRETSFEGLSEKFENGEDGIYTLINDNKNSLLSPKIEITEQDLKDIPELRDLKTQIDMLEDLMNKSTGRKKYMLKKQIIELRKDQYVIKLTIKQPTISLKSTKSSYPLRIDEDLFINTNGDIDSNGKISLFNPKHVSALLCNYADLKEGCWGDFESDMWSILDELETFAEKALAENHPMLYDLLIFKIDGMSNVDIREALLEKYGTTHSLEYISNLWRNKIPKLIAQEAKEYYLVWYYTNVEKGKWKRCSRCGQIKLAHNVFFSKNSSSRDTFYSICKKCRNAKTRKK